MACTAALCIPYLSGLYVETSAGIFFYSHLIAIGSYVVLAMNSKSLGLRRDFLIFFLAVWLMSAAGIIFTGNEFIRDNLVGAIFLSTAKILFVVFFASLYYLVYVSSDRSAEKVFKKYLQVSIFFASLAIGQQVIYVLTGTDVHRYIGNISKNYGNYIGVSALSSEPAFFACALLPAAAYHVACLARRLKLTIPVCVVIVALIFSTSSLGYLGIFLAALLSYLLRMNGRRVLISIITLPILFFALSNAFKAEFFQLRWNDTVQFVMGGDLTMSAGMNLSTYSSAVNISIAAQSVRENYGLGSGFGLYHLVFDQYISGYEQPSYREAIPGRGSAASLLSRLTAEIGLISWAIFAMFFWWGYQIVRRSHLVESGIAYLATISIIALRMGEYYINGVVLAFVMIYLIHMEMLRRRVV